jgi:predicted TPR repeat methyltransferase
MTQIAAARMVATPGLGERLVERGAMLLAARQPADAIALLERAAQLADAPGNTKGLLAEALLETGRIEQALDAADQAIALAPSDAPLLMLRSRIQRALKNSTRALDDAAAAVMVAPGGVETRRWFADCLSEISRHDEAIFLLGQLLEERPEDPQRAAWLGLALLRGDRYEAAEELLGHVAERGAETRGIRLLRVQFAIQHGQPQRAVELAQDALWNRGPDSPLYAALGHAQLLLGQRGEAALAYAEASRLAPADGYLAHIAAALSGGGGGARAGDDYVRQLFDRYAARFETSLLGLGYRVPGLVLRVLEELEPRIAAGESGLGDVLDLGCGTGLAGIMLRDAASGQLVGVDLSASMIEAARSKGLYDELHVAEVGAYLAQEERGYSCIVAADVFCYFGAIGETVAACGRHLLPGGRLIFTVESGACSGGWELAQSMRYRHSEAYIRQVLAEAGLVPEVFRQEVLRHERGEPVDGLLVVGRTA